MNPDEAQWNRIMMELVLVFYMHSCGAFELGEFHIIHIKITYNEKILT